LLQDICYNLVTIFSLLFFLLQPLGLLIACKDSIAFGHQGVGYKIGFAQGKKSFEVKGFKAVAIKEVGTVNGNNHCLISYFRGNAYR
jgi:hypothetical protein